MSQKGKVTKVLEEKRFFFIDNDYFCRYDKIDFVPSVGDQVQYEQSKNRDGKPEAKNVKKVDGFIEQYWNELTKGYFLKEDYIRKEFIIDYAKELAMEFSKNENVNKSTQIRKYFDYCDRIVGVFKTKRDFLYVKAELPKVIPHLNNALKKGLITKSFYDFMEINVELSLINEINFNKGFIPHFEAIIGFSQK